MEAGKPSFSRETARGSGGLTWRIGFRPLPSIESSIQPPRHSTGEENNRKSIHISHLFHINQSTQTSDTKICTLPETIIEVEQFGPWKTLEDSFPLQGSPGQLHCWREGNRSKRLTQTSHRTQEWYEPSFSMEERVLRRMAQANSSRDAAWKERQGTDREWVVSE